MNRRQFLKFGGRIASGLMLTNMLGHVNGQRSTGSAPSLPMGVNILTSPWRRSGTEGSVNERGGVVTIASGIGTAVTAQARVAIDLSNGRYISLKLASLDAGLRQVSVRVSVGDTTFTRAFETTNEHAIDRTPLSGAINHAGVPQRITIGAAHWNAVEGRPDLSDLANVRAIRVIVTPEDGVGTEVTVEQWQVHAPHASSHAEAMLVFDDTRYPETYDVAFPILQAHGVRGCIAVESDRVGQNTVTLDHLHEMYAAGWDMLPHGKWGDSLLQYDYAGKLEQMRDSFDYLEANGFTRSHRHFVLPGGQHDADVWELAHVLGFRSLRIADKHRFETLDPMPELALTRPIQTGIGQDVGLHYGHIDRLRRSGGLAIWEFHRILAEGQSTVSSLDFHGADLDRLLARLDEHEIPVTTPVEVWGN